MSTPSPASCSRKCPNGCRVPRAWRPCASCASALRRVPSPPCGRLATSPRAPELRHAFPPLALPLPSSRCRSRPAPWPPWPSSASPRPRCSALPLSKPSVPSPSSHHAAPLDLLYRRLWPLMLPAVGAAAVAAAATVAAPPQAASGQAEQPSVCARDPWFSPATPPPPTSSLRPQQQVPTTSVFKTPSRTSRSNSTKGEGLSAEPVTHVSSAVRTGL